MRHRRPGPRAGRRSSRRTSAARTGRRSPPRRRPRTRAPGRRCPRPSRRCAPADGDERLISAMRWRPGAARRSAMPGSGAAARARGRTGRSSVAARSARRRSAISSTTLRRPGAGAGSASVERHRAASRSSCRCSRPSPPRAPRRSARSRSSSSTARPASIVSAARSIPSSSVVDGAGRRAARPPALSRTTSRRGAGLAAQDRLDDRGVLGGVATGELRGRRRARARAAAASIGCALDRRRGVTSYSDAAAVERQLVDAVAVDDERPLGARGSRTTSAIRPRRGRRRRRRAAGGVVPAGFVSGPSRLNAVRTPISRRVGPACRIAGWKFGAKRNAKPIVAQRRAGRRGVVVDPDAEGVEHVGRARLRRDRPVAVLGDRHAGGRDDERGRRSRC